MICWLLMYVFVCIALVFLSFACPQVWEAVSPRLQDKPDVLAWLERNTAPLRQQLAATAAPQPAAVATA
jgi:hypothetical protein